MSTCWCSEDIFFGPIETSLGLYPHKLPQQQMLYLVYTSPNHACFIHYIVPYIIMLGYMKHEPTKRVGTLPPVYIVILNWFYKGSQQTTSTLNCAYT